MNKDYMKIRKPAAKLARFLLTKRDLSNEAVDQVFKFVFYLSYDSITHIISCRFNAHLHLI